MRTWTVTIGARAGPPGTNPYGTRLWVHLCADDREQARLSALEFAVPILGAIGERTGGMTIERLAMDPQRRRDEDTLRGRRSGEVYFVEMTLGAS